MEKLKQILQRNYSPNDALGGTSKNDKLIEDLNELRTFLNKRSWLIVGMIFFLYLLSLGIAFIYLNKPEHIVSLFSALGIGTGWSVSQMNKIWKEVAQINLILVLCRSLNQNETNKLIEKLIGVFSKLEK